MSIVTSRAARAGHAAWRSLSYSVILVPLTAAFVALAAAFAAEWLYADRVLPGVTVAGIDVGSLPRAAAIERLEAAVARPWSGAAVVARHEDRAWRTTNGDLGLRPDVAGAVDAAIAYGKTGTPLDRAYAWAGALQGDAHLALSFRSDGAALDRWIAQVAADIDRPVVDGSIAVGAKGLIVTWPAIGAQVNRNAAASAVLAASSFGDREIALGVRRIYPAVDDSGFRDALAHARAVVTPLVVTLADRRVEEDAIGLSTLLRVERVAAKAGELPALPEGALAPAQRYRYAVSLDAGLVKAWSAALAAKLDRPGVNARYAVTEQGAVSVVPGVTGIRIDQEKVAALLMEELLRPAEGTRELVPPTIADPSAFTTEQAKEWLPKLARTSSFTTQFPANRSRHANIATGSSQFDGVVLLPGQAFSFWELLGPVTPERGYAYAGAIINNRSDENVIGGGLCQVSTTLFNAVAKLGYEIVERHAHGYLIERYPIGLDAAVFFPGSDLRWRNDTTSPVFLWSWVGDTSVTFEVWGVPTGRTVTFSAPVQANFVDVPKDQPADPAFPAGYAVRGRSVVVTRTVTAADGTALHRDRFVSWYAPVWGGPAPEGGTLTVR